MFYAGRTVNSYEIRLSTFAVTRQKEFIKLCYQLLEENGLITLKEGVGINATVLDIDKNPKKLEFVELESAQISRMIGEVSFVVLNGNFALQAGLNVKEDAVASENSNSEVIKQQYVNIIAVKEGNENKDAIKTLVDILKSDAIVKYINDTYNGSVIPFK